MKIGFRESWIFFSSEKSQKNEKKFRKNIFQFFSSNFKNKNFCETFFSK